MRVFIASEFRCTIYNEKYYLSPKAYAIYNRYAKSFGKIILCSRFERVTTLQKGYVCADFIEDTIRIDNLQKIILKKYNCSIITKMNNCDLVIVRVPSIIAFECADIARKIGKPYLAESMGDAWDSYWNHGLLGKLIAPYMMTKMKSVVYNADFAIYVTEEFLQHRYPCKNKSISASNVVIKEQDPDVLEYRKQKIETMNLNKISMMTSAGVNVHAKGHKYVFGAMQKLNDTGVKVTYYLAGGGDQTRLKRIAKEKNIMDQVIFLGELPMDEVYHYLDLVDIYIQPSLQEGLPRAVIEAMSRACPCLGSNTAGTPELLDRECIFKRKSETAIVNSIKWMINQNMFVYSKKNYEKAGNYLEETLDARREQYFDYVKQSVTKGI